MASSNISCKRVYAPATIFEIHGYWICCLLAAFCVPLTDPTYLEGRYVLLFNSESFGFGFLPELPVRVLAYEIYARTDISED